MHVKTYLLLALLLPVLSCSSIEHTVVEKSVTVNDPAFDSLFGRGPSDVWDRDDGVYVQNGAIYIIGEIDSDAALDFVDLVDRTRATRVEIWSTGGYVEAAEIIAYVIEQEGMTVNMHRECSSACLIIAAGSVRRTHTPGDFFVGLHRSTYGFLSGYGASLIHDNMSPAALALANATSNDELHKVEGSTLRGLNIVTE